MQGHAEAQINSHYPQQTQDRLSSPALRDFVTSLACSPAFATSPFLAVREPALLNQDTSSRLVTNVLNAMEDIIWTDSKGHPSPKARSGFQQQRQHRTNTTCKTRDTVRLNVLFRNRDPTLFSTISTFGPRKTSFFKKY